MSEALLILVGVAVFTVTVVGTLWYFYVLLKGIEPQLDRPVGHEVQPGVGTGNP